MKRPLLKLIFLLVLTGALLYFFGRSVEWREVPAQIAAVNPPLFLLAVALAALHFVTRSLRWQILIARQKLDVRFRNLVAANVVGFTVSAVVPGRLGELVKPVYLARKESLPAGFTIGTVVIERIFDLTTQCFLVGAFLISRPLFAGSWPVGADAGRNLTFWGTAGVALAAVLVGASVALFVLRDKALRAVGFLLKPLPERARAAVLRALASFIEGLKIFRTPRQLALYAVLSLIVWLGIVLFYWVFFFAYRVKVPYFMVVPYVFLTAVGASIPTPGMVGGFHYFSKLGMVLLLGLQADRAAGLTLVAHAVQIAVTCALGYAILAREGLTRIYALTLTLTVLVALFGAFALAYVMARRLALPLYILAE
ncbi:MAG TPA: lysylphosphatidylglycerol synthase transmembrane domain-containing protein, partial [Candidatus Aminicenantes bacterium]|nr:lysylphosphatidylglycerol synthase transmembrane domain-containing protein [Candidatus Aminicenantes bacterium]